MTTHLSTLRKLGLHNTYNVSLHNRNVASGQLLMPNIYGRTVLNIVGRRAAPLQQNHHC